eukprot:7373042-Pyramimonas_sp.AAC.1
MFLPTAVEDRGRAFLGVFGELRPPSASRSPGAHWGPAGDTAWLAPTLPWRGSHAAPSRATSLENLSPSGSEQLPLNSGQSSARWRPGGWPGVRRGVASRRRPEVSSWPYSTL